LLLRHDVDHSPADALKMFEIESKYSVKSTYYFRWSTFQEEIMKKIKDSGFEVGLHFETIATYAKANKLNSIGSEDIEKCRIILEKEIERFILLFGNLNSICSHGAHENRKFRIPNTVLVNDDIKNKYGIFEAYDIKDEFDAYISDRDFTVGVWRYNINPLEEFDKGTKRIYFLSHPIHWGRNLIKRYCMSKFRKSFKQYNV
jgi:hypothetical protein